MRIWKDIKGYEGIYQVSNDGCVRTFLKKDGLVGYKLCDKPKMMAIINKDNGYKYVTLSKNGKRHNHYVHRLVAEAFMGDIPNGYVINHLDYDRTNNNVENLEITTQLGNIDHSRTRMQTPRPSGADYYICYREKQNNYEVTVCRKYLGRYATLEEARKARDEYIEKIHYY